VCDVAVNLAVAGVPAFAGIFTVVGACGGSWQPFRWRASLMQRLRTLLLLTYHRRKNVLLTFGFSSGFLGLPFCYLTCLYPVIILLHDLPSTY
jgi:hypothetical protein